MRARRSRNLEVLSVSAIDLFASALGVFMLIAILLFPYYLRQPSIEAQEAGAEAQLRAAGADADDAIAGLRQAQAERAAAARARVEAATARARAEGEKAQAEAELFSAQARATAAEDKAASTGPQASNIPITDLDLVFVIDTTRSMRRPIANLREDLKSIVRVLSDLAPSLRAGVVAYRDQDAEAGYVTRVFEPVLMTPSGLDALQAFVDRLDARGGKDWPERVDTALTIAAAFDWRPDAHGRIILIGDAHAHPRDWPAAFAAVDRFLAAPGAAGATRRVAAIYSGRRGAALEKVDARMRRMFETSKAFMERAATRGGGRMTPFSPGRMLEQVLLSVIEAGDFAR